MDMDSPAWRFTYWVMAWTPLAVLIIGNERWSFATGVVITLCAELAVLATSIAVAIGFWLFTGREPNFKSRADADRGPFRRAREHVGEPSSHVRTMSSTDS